MPIDPLYGIELTANELTNQIPMSPIYGVTPNNKFIPIKIDETGRLELSAGLTLSVSDLQIGAVEIKNHNTDDRASVTTDNELITEARLHDESGTGITSTLVTTKQGLDVNVIGGSALSVSEDEDGDVPANQSSVGLLIGLNYGYDGISWKRIGVTGDRMHTDVHASGTSLSSTGTSLDVNVTGGAVGGPSDTEDGSVAGGQDANLSIGLNYGWNGVTWERINSSSNRLIVDGSQVTQPISATSLPLPTGAATEATLSAIDSDIDVALSTRASETTLSGFRTDFNAVDFATETTLATLLTEATFTARINTLGQKTSANSTPVVLASDQSTISTNTTDRVAREVGRVSGNHTIHTEESYITTDTDVNARPTNGDFNLQHHKTKTAVVRNTGANTARVNVLGSVDGGTNFDIVIANNTAVSAGDVLIVDEERAMTHMRIEARSAVAGNSTTIVTRGYSLGI